MMRRTGASHFDPDVLDAFLNIVDDFMAVRLG